VHNAKQRIKLQITNALKQLPRNSNEHMDEKRQQLLSSRQVALRNVSIFAFETQIERVKWRVKCQQLSWGVARREKKAGRDLEQQGNSYVLAVEK